MTSRTASLALVLFFVGTLSFTSRASAQTAGQISLGVNFGIVTNTLKDLNSLQATADSISDISTKELGDGLEVSGTFGYRFAGSVWALHLAPSFYWNGQKGTRTSDGKTFEYKAHAIVAMPMMRVYPLENDVLQLFFQIGVGWAQINGEINEADDKTSFHGSNLGYQVGMGINLCYDVHCLNIEGNVRYLEVERSIVDKSTSSGSHADGRITQSTPGQELEIDGTDLSTNLSGVQILAGYVFKF